MADRNGYIGRSPGDSAVIIARQSFSPTGIQTNFTFSSGYTVGYIDLYLNGARLVEGQDFTATDGSVVGLTTNAVDGDVLELVAYKAFNAVNVSAATGDFSVGGNLSVTGNTEVTGTLTVGGVEVQPGAAGTWASYDSNTGISTTKKVKVDNDFEVTGVGTFASRVSIGDSIFHVGDDNTAFGFPAADTFTVYTGGGERFRVHSTGNVGVGTLVPGEKFTVQNGNIRLESNEENQHFITFQQRGTGGRQYTITNAGVSNVHGQAAGDFYLRDSTAATNRIIINSSGNVAIGLTNPGALLSLAGGESATPRFAIENTTSSSNDFTITQYEDGNGVYTLLGQNVKLDVSGNNSVLDASFKTAAIQLDARNHGAVSIITGGTNSASENVKIDANGNIGIGSLSPKYRIDTGVAAGIGTIRLRSTITGEAAIRIGARNSDVNLIRVDGDGTAAFGETDNAAYGFGIRYMGTRAGNNNALAIYSDNQTGTEVEAVTVQQDGFLGINQATPTSRLHVVGDVLVSGIGTATQWDATSDIALKENIEVIDNPITKLSELKGVTFDWKAGGHSVGVIAQDVEKVLPTAVGGSKDHKTVNYNAIIGLLVESVKDQQKQIEELKSLLDK